MNVPRLLPLLTTLLLISSIHSPHIIAQSPAFSTDEQALTQQILTKDSVFWGAYNDCDLQLIATFLSPDLEFYHDKIGLITSADALLKSIREGLCGDQENFRLRREVVTGSVEVFPVPDYGAIMTGSHRFFITQGNQPEYADGIARFTHLWRRVNDEWRISRVLSYDHLPAPTPMKSYVQVNQEELSALAGRYRSQAFGPMVIKVGDNELVLSGEAGLQFHLLPNGPNSFRAKEKNFIFEFTFDDSGKVEKFTIFENENRVDEALPR